MFGLFKQKKISIIAPLEGEIVDLSEVPDEVFAQRMVGEGFAIKPTNNLVISPCNGKIKLLFQTKHAIGIQTVEGLELLIHVGLDTVELNGVGFESLVTVGQTVQTGTPLIRFDDKLIVEHKKQLITPIVITNKEKIKNLKVNYGNHKIAAEVELK